MDRIMLAAAWFLAFTGARASSAEDWPTYRHDNARSGRTSPTLALDRLQEQWAWHSPQPPQTAWAGPAKWDAYGYPHALPAMRDYDRAFHAVAAEGCVWFGSSADDSVYCLDAATGRRKWRYTTDGAVRIAPTYCRGKLFFGSDDGYAYCLNAGDGRLVWKHSPSSSGRRVLHNGRLISLWPCRTGVMIEGDTAHFATGMFPWEPTYLAAVDVETGKSGGQGRHVLQIRSASCESPLLASPKWLFAPQGRVPPLAIERETNKVQAVSKERGGGSFALLADDRQLLFGPGNRQVSITQIDMPLKEKPGKPVQFPGAAAVVDGGVIYVLTASKLSALDRSDRKPRWTAPCQYGGAVILAGDTLVTGGRGGVAAFRAADGQRLWDAALEGNACGLAVAGGALLASTDDGAIHCFRPGSAKGASRRHAPQEMSPPSNKPRFVRQSPMAELALGPYLEFTGPSAAVVRWETHEGLPTLLELSGSGDPRRLEDPAPKTRHEVRLANLRWETVYSYRIGLPRGGKLEWLEPVECDTAFNFSRLAIPDRPSPYPQDATTTVVTRAAEQILADTDVRQGICLVLGAGRAQLAYELARRSMLRVIAFDTDADRVAQARVALHQAGLYGTHVAVHQVDSLEAIPCVGGLANLVVFEALLLDGRMPSSAKEVARLLRPGGMAWLGELPDRNLSRQSLTSWFDAAGLQARVLDDQRGLRACLIRTSWADTGVWSHQYGRPDNAAFGGETLCGARATGELDVQWLGQPGPAFQADRNGRKPSPLAIGGRLFVQGLHRIAALDAYNGAVLWSRELPLERFNIPRDSSNWCADESSLFAAIHGKCWQLDAASGRLVRTYPVLPGPKPDWTWHWGYVASVGDMIVGSAIKAGSSFTDFWGNNGWYDSWKVPALNTKVGSDRLFALEKGSGKTRWSYAGGVILNSTITIGDDRVWMVECRSPALRGADVRRVSVEQPGADLFLVALDLANGRKLWDRPLATLPGKVVFYLACGGGKLVLVSSDTRYHVYAFEAVDGRSAWDAHFDWEKDNHGAHMSRPAIVGQRVFVRPKVLDLKTGQVENKLVPPGGCGTYAATSQMLVYRAGNVTLWDFEQDKASSWSRLRPDCWISTIPACGLILSPEAGGGCSCGVWLETSIAFRPKQRE